MTVAGPYVYLDGRLVPREDAKVSVEDRGFTFGDGIYEVVRIAASKSFRLDAHLDRLEAGAQALEIPLPLDRAALAEAIHSVARANALTEGTVYLQLTRGTAPRSHAFPAGAAPTLVMMAKPLAGPDPQLFESGVSAVTCPDLRFGFCEIKTIGLLPNVLAYQKARSRGCYEALLVRQGKITEGCLSSAFCARGGTVFTHPVDNILPSVTRRFLIEAFRSAGVEVREEAVTIEELLAADEVMMVGTTTEVMPVVRVDDSSIGEGRPGEIARLGRRLYLEDLERARSGPDE
ncbi:MAG: D-amino acid aminotransferase [Acidobacteria bacterium]|nr:D-amino acid aminotransferase [Acidobacteriota bacterium]